MHVLLLNQTVHLHLGEHAVHSWVVAIGQTLSLEPHSGAVLFREGTSCAVGLVLQHFCTGCQAVTVLSTVSNHFPPWELGPLLFPTLKPAGSLKPAGQAQNLRVAPRVPVRSNEHRSSFPSQG